MIFTFIIELILALILWLTLKRLLMTINPYAVLSICLAVALIVGFIVEYRGTGFKITQSYLERINNQKIELTGESITLEEQNLYKEELFRTKEYKTTLIISSAKTSLFPFILIIFIMLLFVRRTLANFTSSLINNAKK